MYHLGLLDERGTEVPQNLDEAMRLYHQAAALGKAEARIRLNQIASGTPGQSLRLGSVQPSTLAPGQMRQYRISGSGLTLQSVIQVDNAVWVGSRPNGSNNHRPVEVAQDGSWMKVFAIVP